MIFLAAAEEPNVLRVHWDEVVFGTIAFLLLLGVIYKMWPRFTKMLDERANQIEGGIERSKQAETEAQETLEQYRAQLAEARQEAAQMREKAKEQGAAIVAEMREEAQTEARRIVENAHAQIEADRQHALTQLRGEIGQLSMDLAGRIVGETLSEDAAQRRVIDRFMEELEQGEGAQRAEVR